MATKKAETDDADGISVPALVVTPNKAIAVSGNFEEIEEYLTTACAKFKKKKMTLEQAKAAKKELQTYRTSLEKINDQVKKDYFNGPKSVFDSKMKSLLAIIAPVEQIADEKIAEEDQIRIDNLNTALDEYKAELQELHKLSESYLSRVEYKKQYYNKTASEADARADIAAQFASLAKAQKAEEASIRMIKQLCADDERLNVMHWLEKLEGEDSSVVVEALIAEKDRLRTLDKAKTTAEAPAAQSTEDEPIPEEERLTIGVLPKIKFSSDLPGRTKKMRVEMTYPIDLGPALGKLYEALEAYGIFVREVTSGVQGSCDPGIF